jgi:phage terminase small subunit
MPKPRRKKPKPTRQKRDRSALSLKQQRFVLALVGEAKGSAAEAARLAGYRSKTAQGYARIGEENQRKPEISRAIEAARAALVEKGMANAVELSTFLTNAVRAANKHLADPEAVTAKTVEQFGPLMHVGLTAASHLVKIQGLAAPKKVELSGAVETTIALSPELEAALDEWLLIRSDPRVQAVIAEMRG